MLNGLTSLLDASPRGDQAGYIMTLSASAHFLNRTPQSADVRHTGLDIPVDPDRLPVPVLGGAGARLLLLGHRRLLLLPALLHGRQEDRPQVLPREGQGVGAQGEGGRAEGSCLCALSRGPDVSAGMKGGPVALASISDLL